MGMIGRVLVLVAAVACLASPASASDKEEAKRLFESGLKLMTADDFGAAAANFERSVALYPTQNSLFNLANCYKALQRYAEALETLKRLHRDFGDKLKPEIKEAAEQQEAEIRSVAATLTVKVAPAGAKVVLDGREMSATALSRPLLLAPGDHTIEASLAGYRATRRSVRLVSGAERSEEIVLSIEPGYLLVRSEPAGAAVVVDGEQKATTPLIEPVALTPGPHTVAVRLAGRREAERRVEIRAGERQVLELVLPALDLAAPPVPAMTEEVALPGAEVAGAVAHVGEAKPRTRFWKILAWSSSAGALAAGATAMVFWKVLGDGHFEEARYYEGVSKTDPQAKAKGETLVGEANHDGNIAIGFGIGAGVLAVTALVSFLADSGQSSGETSVSVSPAGLGVRF